METNRDKLMKEIMATDFTSFDLHLYLDTHPCDQRAINMYNCTVQKAKMLKNNYERLFGPLSPGISKCPWQWINSPWPWQRQ